MLLRRTWKFGALFSVYLFLVAPADARKQSTSQGFVRLGFCFCFKVPFLEACLKESI